MCSEEVAALDGFEEVMRYLSTIIRIPNYDLQDFGSLFLDDDYKIQALQKVHESILCSIERSLFYFLQPCPSLYFISDHLLNSDMAITRIHSLNPRLFLPYTPVDSYVFPFSPSRSMTVSNPTKFSPRRASTLIVRDQAHRLQSLIPKIPPHHQKMLPPLALPRNQNLRLRSINSVPPPQTPHMLPRKQHLRRLSSNLLASSQNSRVQVRLAAWRQPNRRIVGHGAFGRDLRPSALENWIRVLFLERDVEAAGDF